ncbi:MAG: hypothetical protein L3K16_01200 [Thermoplasmata archaeon]|nr:hypothetical protein [Thermoplasmata archaeon]
MSVLQRIPFVAALAILAAGTATGVYVSAKTHEWLWFVVAIAVVAVLAVLYLREYAKLPGPEDRPPPAPRPPVVEAPAATAAETDSEGTVDPARASTGPVEVDKFDPDYDPVAEADALETTAPKPAAPEP